MIYMYTYIHYIQYTRYIDEMWREIHTHIGIYIYGLADYVRTLPKHMLRRLTDFR